MHAFAASQNRDWLLLEQTLIDNTLLSILQIKRVFYGEVGADTRELNGFYFYKKKEKKKKKKACADDALPL